MIEACERNEGGAIVLRVSGRLDREWAQHLSDMLASLLRDGERALVLDLAGVTYVSSPAVSVLRGVDEEVSLLRGRLRLEAVSPALHELFAVTGWDASGDTSQSSGRLAPGQSSWYSRSGWDTAAQVQITQLAAGATLTCRLHGAPALSIPSGPEHVCGVWLPPGGFSLGVGAAGVPDSGIASILGELLAVAGCVAAHPSGGTRLPDYLVAAPGQSAPVSFGYGLSCHGDFARLVRFAEQADSGAVPLSDLAAYCLTASGGNAAGMVVAAETAHVCGARLRQSPAEASLRFDVPAVRRCLSFSPERAGAVRTALLAGVVAQRTGGALAPFLRPLGSSLVGHFHAALFSYRPLPQRTVDLAALVRSLFERQVLREVLHLVWDDRSEAAVQETSLVRGVAWVAPIAGVEPAHLP